jgi:hypothetical protein
MVIDAPISRLFEIGVMTPEESGGYASAFVFGPGSLA